MKINTVIPKPIKAYDLHNHSIVSKDGGTPEKQIIDLAAERGLKGIGICDHDEFPDESLYNYAEQKGIKLALGIEFSCKKAHIIGYNMNITDDRDRTQLEKYFNLMKSSYVEAAKKMIRAFRADCIDISHEEIQRAYNKKHVQKLFIFKYLAEKMDLGFESWGEVRQWLKRQSNPDFYVVDGKNVIELDPVEVIHLIHRAGGYAIWAHPFMTHPLEVREKYFDLFIQAGIDAVEADYAYQENGYSGKESNEALDSIIRKRLTEANVPVSGGSDSHFPHKTYADKTPIQPGDFGITEEEFQLIQHMFK
ncbi:MAG: PHP domain-containing protein [Pseudomonadota bacterium]